MNMDTNENIEDTLIQGLNLEVHTKNKRGQHNLQ